MLNSRNLTDFPKLQIANLLDQTGPTRTEALKIRLEKIVMIKRSETLPIIRRQQDYDGHMRNSYDVGKIIKFKEVLVSSLINYIKYLHSDRARL